ncbi:MAG: agmatinase [Thermodesulfobacteriota bacterium]
MIGTRFLEAGAAGISPCRVSILPAPLAATVSWMAGTDQGPAAILAASDTLELLDDELLIETWRLGIETLPALELADLAVAAAWERIRTAVAGELARGRFVVTIGGEHGVTVPAVTAYRARYPDLTVVQIDAHLDLRDAYEGEPCSHASVMRRLHDLGLPFVQVGIRSFSREEWLFCRETGITFFSPARLRQPGGLAAILARVRGPVYLTIDVDGLDPAVMPATGTPEPDGLSWVEATGFIRALAGAHPIVGLDLVELAPLPGLHHAAFTAAKLLYRSLGYILGAELPALDRG